MAWLLPLILWLILFGLTRFVYQRGRLKSPWHLDVAALGLLALAALGFFWRVVVGQNWMPADGGDLVSFLFPTYRFAAAALHQGSWPLWNPALYGGAPHIGDIQAGFLYPPNLLLFLLKPDFPYVALQWLSIGHVWFAGAGMYLLLARGLPVRRVAALTGALAFMFSDAFLMHFGNLNFNAVASWLPWVFWAFAGSWKLEAGNRSSLVTRDPLRALARVALAGVLLGIATLAGHIQATLFIVMALAIYTGLWLWLNREEPQPGRRAVAALVSLSTCLLVSFLLAAPILLPAFQLTGYTARAGWDYTQAAGYSLSPAQWIGWLIPGFFGRGPQFHWGAWPRVEVGYIGIQTLVLAGLALALRRERRTWAWAGLAGITFVLALGIYAIPHGWLTLLPGFGQLRAPARLVLLTDFALAALAAIGLDAALRPLEGAAKAAFEKVWRIVAYATAAVLAIGVPLAYVALLLVQDREPAIESARLHHADRSRQFCRAAVGEPPVAVGAARELGAGDHVGLAGRGAGPARSREPGRISGPGRPGSQPGVRAARHRRLPGRPVGRAVPDRHAHGHREPVAAGHRAAVRVRGRGRRGESAGAGRRDALLGEPRLALQPVVRPAQHPLRDRQEGRDAGLGQVRAGVRRRPAAQRLREPPRPAASVLAAQIQPAASHEDAWNAIHAPDFDPAITAAVEGASASTLNSTLSSGQVTEIASAPNRLTVKVDADGPALLVLSQFWYPGWQVTVDGRAQGAPLRTDYLFQGVPVEGGSHTVELRFTSPLWRLGWVLAGVAAVILLVGSLFVILRRR